MRFPSLLSAVPPCLAAGCLGAFADGSIEDQAAADLQDLAAVLADLGGSASGLGPGPGFAASPAEEATMCYPTWDGCQVCYSLNGHVLAGTASVYAEPLPCEVSVSWGGRTVAWTLTAYDLTATWDGNLAGDYDLSLVGARASETTLSGGRHEGVYDSSFEIVSATASYLDGAVTDVDVSLRYTGWGGGTWELSASLDGSSWSGTITGPDGASCTVSGTLGSVAVSCDPATE